MELSASVVVPAYNRREVLPKALASLFGQSADPSSYELIVVDDGSTDGTAEVVKAMTASSPCILRYLHIEHGGRARACNAGIRAAVGKFVVILDSDMVVPPGFLAAHLEAHDRPGLIVRGPVVDTARLDDPMSEPAVFPMSRAFFSANSSTERIELLKAGLFDEEFTEYGWEDLEFGFRLRQRGLSLRRCPPARSYHLQAPLRYEDLPNLIRREHERGHMAVLYYRKHPTRHVRMSTQITPVLFALDRLLPLGRLLGRPAGFAFLRRLDKGRRLGFRLLVPILRTHAYADGLREALAAGESRIQTD